MPHTVVITTHPGAALAKACMRGSWVPLLLLAASVAELLSSERASTVPPLANDCGFSSAGTVCYTGQKANRASCSCCSSVALAGSCSRVSSIPVPAWISPMVTLAR